MKALLAIIATPALLLGQTPPQSTPAPSTIAITEWEVPYENSRPRDPYVDGQGRVWFVGQRSDYVAYYDQKSGDFERFALDSGAGPHNLIVDADGSVWYAGNRAAHIGKLDPASGRITKYPMPDSTARDPHTLVFDGAGDIWFTSQGSGYVGKLTTSTGEVELVRIPTPRSRPYGIVVDENGRPWFNELGVNRIGTIDPNTMALREFTLPAEGARTRRIALTSDGMVWFVDYARGYLGRLDPETGAVAEWAAPSGAESRPYAMTVDDRDRLWFVETGVDPNRMVGFDPATERFFSITDIESGGGTVRHMIFHEPSRSIWFGTDENTLGRAQVP
ncbi:MAG: virginiamycin B lyase family protein [Gemmatimonadaceae bacterium]